MSRQGNGIFGEFCNGFKKRAAGRIFGVETEQIRGAVGEFVDIVIHFLEDFRAVDEVVEAAGKNGAESGVDRGSDAVFCWMYMSKLEVMPLVRYSMMPRILSQ